MRTNRKDDGDSVYSELGRALRSRREALGLTQENLAALAECGSLFVIQLEQGKRTVRLDKLVSVMQVLGLQLRVENGKVGIEVADELGS